MKKYFDIMELCYLLVVVVFTELNGLSKLIELRAKKNIFYSV